MSPTTAHSPTQPSLHKLTHPSGKIANIDITTDDTTTTKSATVTFEKETAARTALLLNQTSLGGKDISVTAASSPTSDSSSPDTFKSTTEQHAEDGTPVLSQEEKPHSRVLAEVLAHGYLVAETGLQKALSLDEQHGISTRFLTTLKTLDAKTHARDHARAADATYNLSGRATSLWTGLGSYFEKASSTPTGKKIVEFYSSGQKQVQDIHNEARRLAELKKEENGGSALRASGLERVLGRFGGGDKGEKAKEEGTAAAEGKEVPGGAPSDAVATESGQGPTKEAGMGKVEVIH